MATAAAMTNGSVPAGDAGIAARSARAVISVPAVPAIAPTINIARIWRSTSRTTADGAAPSASRTPSSRKRRPTMNAVIP